MWIILPNILRLMESYYICVWFDVEKGENSLKSGSDGDPFLYLKGWYNQYAYCWWTVTGRSLLVLLLYSITTPLNRFAHTYAFFLLWAWDVWSSDYTMSNAVPETSLSSSGSGSGGRRRLLNACQSISIAAWWRACIFRVGVVGK